MSQDEIARLEKKLGDADRNTDVDTRSVVEELFDDKVIIVSDGGVTVDKAYLLGMHTLPKRFNKIEREKLDITVFTDSAIVHSLNTCYPETGVPFKIMFLRVWSKRNGQWRIVGGSATRVEK